MHSWQVYHYLLFVFHLLDLHVHIEALAPVSLCHGIAGYIMAHVSGPICCSKVVLTRRLVRLAKPAPRPSSSSLSNHTAVVFGWPQGTTRTAHLPGASCPVAVRKVGPLDFTASPADCCLDQSRRNQCCGLLAPTVQLLTDDARLPVCGRFLHNPVNQGAGLGHTVAEHNANAYYATLLGLQRVRGVGAPLGRPSNPLVVRRLYGMEEKSADRLWTWPQLQEAAARGFLTIERLQSADDLLSRIVSAPPNVVYTFETPINAGDMLAATGWEYAARLESMQREGLLQPSPYDPTAINVALHIRRGDVGTSMTNRFLELDYYVAIGRQLLSVLDADRVGIFVVSQGLPTDFRNLTAALPGARLVLMGDAVPVLHSYLLHADVLVTSRSGYSHLAAEIGDAMVVAHPFWHQYGASKDRVVLAHPGTHTLNLTDFTLKFCRSRHCGPCAQPNPFL
jgi:hypothetical protein